MTPDPALEKGALAGEELTRLVGSEHVRPGQPQDFVAGARAEWVVAPGSETEVASVLCYADESRLAVIPRGGGTKSGWGNPPRRADIVLSLTRLDQVVEHVWQDLTVTVEAGCSFRKLQAALAKHGQRLALDPLWPEDATIGGILSANDTGVLRLSYGGLRDLIIGVTLVLADGTVARSGGKVVKNVAGYDLPKLAIGGLGSLGVVTRVVLRVHPIPARSRVLSLPVQGPEEAQKIVLKLLDAKLSLAALQARFDSGGAAFLDIGLEGAEAGLAAQQHLLEGLLPPGLLESGSPEVWVARQDLWALNDTGTVAKISVPPASIGTALQLLDRLAQARNVAWSAVVQATGIGWLSLSAGDQDFAAVMELRSAIEAAGGSLVILRMPAAGQEMDAWGNIGDALPLMRALKQQFDPNGTLNPGRYVGGI